MGIITKHFSEGGSSKQELWKEIEKILGEDALWHKPKLIITIMSDDI